jgi:DNA (cytosine-5)-methyltransferase 1
MKFTFVDLFAGIGGFHAALGSIGGECVFASDVDEAAREVYQINWMKKSSRIELVGDIRPFTEGSRVRVPKHDVLTAGFPCQPFSKSGQQKGVNEARGTLFYNILRIVEAKKPQIVLLENVRNLIGPKHIQDFRLMMKMLRELGYAVSETPSLMSPHLLPRTVGGTPQHRERIFIGAFYVGAKNAQKLKNMPPMFDRNPFNLDPHVEWDIRDYIIDKEKLSKESLSEAQLNENQKKAFKIWSNFVELHSKFSNSPLPGLPLWTEFWVRTNKLVIAKNTPDWKANFIRRNSEFYTKNQRWIDPWRSETRLDDLIPSYRKFEWQAGTSKNLKDCLIQFRPSGIRVKHPSYVPAFVAISQTPVIGWMKRELTVEEAKVLQGFPDNFKFGNQRNSLSMKQIGNAVHPGVSQFVFKELLKQAAAYDQTWAKEKIHLLK